MTILYYLGLRTGKDMGLEVGRASYVRGDRYGVRFDQWRSSSTDLTIDRELTRFIALHTGTDADLRVPKIDTWHIRANPAEGYFVYGMTEKIRTARNFTTANSSEFWKESGSTYDKYGKDSPILVPYQDWDFNELAKGKVTLVLADYNPRTNHLTVRYSAEIKRGKGGLASEKTYGSVNNCIYCATDSVKTFLYNLIGRD